MTSSPDDPIPPHAWLDPERRPWLIDTILRTDPEVVRLGEDVERAADRLRLALDDVQWILVVAYEEACTARAVSAQDAIVEAVLRGCGARGAS